MDNRREHELETYRENGRQGKRNQALRVVIIVALVLLVALWGWKAVQIHSIRKEAREENEKVRTTAVYAIEQNSREQLQLLTKPLVWAIRAEMLRGNMEQVNLYLQDMVKEKNFRRIDIADDKGVIVASTDKKNEGQPLEDAGRVMQGDSTVVQNMADSTWVISSPIMGLTNRLGTLVIGYAKPRTVL